VAFVHGSLFPFKLRLERIYGSLYLEAVRKGLGRGLKRQNPQRGIWYNRSNTMKKKWKGRNV
jgi:hypothetical protein